MIGQRLSHYQITAKIGSGGMGEVYRAKDTKLERDVAFKVLPEKMASDPTRLSRFQREARTVAALNHPNIVTIYSVEEADGVHFLTMELVAGKGIDELLPAGGFPLERFFAVAIPIADAVATAHARGIVHRDLKPANVMVTEEGDRVKVLDFGLAKLAESAGGSEDLADLPTLTQTQHGLVMGTPQYMSPEQARGAGVDHRSDIFSLGAMFFEMATGQRPFEGANAIELISAILKDPAPMLSDIRPQLPRHLGRVIGRCLEKAPEDRYQTARDIFNELRALREETRSGAPESRSQTAVSGVEPGELRRVERRGGFVGRDAERARLDEMLESAKQGQGGLVLLGGEPGVGKTRLAAEILEDGRERGMLALTGHAYEDETAPFIISTEILEEMMRLVPENELREMLGADASELSRLLPALRRMFPNIRQPEELPPEQQQRVLFNGVLDFVRRASARSPLVVLLDDLHWADESSLKLLEHITPRLGELPILMLATYRDAETEMGEVFTKTLANLVRRRLAERLAIKRFDQRAVGDLLAARGGSDPPDELVGAIYQGTEGNAFFVEEMFRHLSEEGVLFDEEGDWRSNLDVGELDVPEGVRLVTARRLERLEDNTLEVLTTAAGIGLRFDLDVLEAAVGDPDAALDGVEEAESAQLVVPAVGRRKARYEFSHALVRQTLLAALSVPRLQRLHLGIADAMEAVHGDRAPDHASDIAQQLLAAGTRAGAGRTRSFLRLAGEQALETAAADEALLAFERALELEDEMSDEERARLTFLRGLAYRALGRHGVAASIWSEALPLLESVNRADLVADVCRQLSYYHSWAQGFDEAKALAQRGLQAIGNAPSRERSRLLSVHALAHSAASEFEEADRLNDEAIAIAKGLGDDRLLGGEVLLTQLYRYEHALRADDMAETGARAIDLVRRHGSPWEQTSTIGTTLLGRFWRGEFGSLRELVEDVLPIAEREGNVGTLVHCLVCSSLAALAKDDLKSAIEWSSRYIRLCEQHQMPWGSLGYTYRGVAHLWSNRLEAAASDFEHGVAAQLVAKAHYGIEAAGALYGFAMMGSERAVELYESDYPLPALDRDSTEGEWQWCMARILAAVLLGRTEDAAEWLPQLEKLIGQGTKVALGLGLTAKIAGLAAAAGDDRVAAERHFETAIRQADELPYHTEQAEARRWYAWALERLDRRANEQRVTELRRVAAKKYLELGGFQPIEREA